MPGGTYFLSDNFVIKNSKGPRGKNNLIYLKGRSMRPQSRLPGEHYSLLFHQATPSLPSLDPWRTFWADTVPFKGPRLVCYFQKYKDLVKFGNRGLRKCAFVEISLVLVVPKIGETWPPSIIIISIFDEIIGGEFHRQVFHWQHTSVVQTTLIDLFMTETKNVNTWEELDLIIKQSRLLRKISDNINIFPVKGAFASCAS